MHKTIYNMKNILSRQVVTASIVWLFSFLVTTLLTSLIPFLSVGNEHWPTIHTCLDKIPAIALVALLLVGMAKCHDYDILALIVTFILGLPGVLFYYLIPRKKMYLYGLLLSVGALTFLPNFFHWVPASTEVFFNAFNMFVKIAVLLFLTLTKSPEVRSGQMVWLWLIGLYSPACAVLLYYLFAEGKVSVQPVLKYLIPTAIMSLLWVCCNLMQWFINLLVWMSEYLYSFVSLAIYLTFLDLIIGVYIFIVMLCDPKVKSVKGYGWLAVAAIFNPFLLFPSALLLPRRDPAALQE